MLCCYYRCYCFSVFHYSLVSLQENTIFFKALTEYLREENFKIPVAVSKYSKPFSSKVKLVK